MRATAVLILIVILSACGGTRHVKKNVLKEEKKEVVDSIFRKTEKIKSLKLLNDRSLVITESEITTTFKIVEGKDRSLTSVPVKQVERKKIVEKKAVSERKEKEELKEDAGRVKKDIESDTVNKDKEVAVERKWLFDNRGLVGVVFILIAGIAVYLKYRK